MSPSTIFKLPLKNGAKSSHTICAPCGPLLFVIRGLNDGDIGLVLGIYGAISLGSIACSYSIRPLNCGGQNQHLKISRSGHPKVTETPLGRRRAQWTT